MRRRDFLKQPAAAALLLPSAAATARPRVWRASWIWAPPPGAVERSDRQRMRNSYFYARREFDLAAVPGKAEARVSADSRYLLFVNGRRIGFGPARCDPRWQCYDVYTKELLPALRVGKNVVAALVHHIGEGTYSYIAGRAGFLFEAEIGVGGKTVELQSDHLWKVFPGLAWQYVPSRISYQTDFPEIFDARREPVGWNVPGFDDRSWGAPQLIGPPPVAPWGEMVPRDIPFFAEHDVLPVSTLAQGTSVPMERELVLDLQEMFGRRKGTAEIRAAAVAELAGEATLVIGYPNACEVSVNGEPLWKGGRYAPRDPRRHRGRDVLPPVRLKAGRNEVLIRFELPAASPFLYLGHLGPAAGLRLENDAARVNPQTEIAVLQQTERLIPAPKPAWPVTRIEPSGRDAYLLLDFGKEVFGYPTLAISAADQGIIDMGYSELLVDGRAVPNKRALSYADRYILRPGPQTWHTFEKRAFRYMQLDFRKLTAPVAIDRIGLRFSTYPVEYKGRFHCSDETLDRIWEMGRYTVQLNMDDAFTDCPWRERGQYMGDARVEGLVSFYAFGDSLLLKRCLRQMGQSQTGDGLTYGVYPAEADSRIASFTLLWIVSMWDCYLHTGDVALLGELYPGLRKALGFFERWVNGHGLVGPLPRQYPVFIDWSAVDMRGETTALNCLYAGTLDVAARIAAALGRPRDRDTYSAMAVRTRGAVRERLWSGGRSVFADCRTEDGLSGSVSQAANALAVLHGAAPAGRERSILENILKPGAAAEVATPYFSFYLLRAMYRAGMHGPALEYIRRRWSEMLAAGATTCWEAWSPLPSWCHGWSAGPTYDLIAEYAGIQPLAPGFRRVLIRPHPGSLAFASAAVPTPRGEVGVEWRVSGDAFALEIDLPRGTGARLSLPRVRPQWRRLLADGKDVAPLKVSAATIDLDWNVPGRHHFECKG